MQYILSEDEYKELKHNVENSMPNDELSQRCVILACSLKISGWWNKGSAPSPWGCPNCHMKHKTKKKQELVREQIHHGEYDGDDYSEYCDDCPVQDICPSQKHFSK